MDAEKQPGVFNSFAVEVRVVRQRLSVYVQLPTERGVPKPAA